MPYRKRIFTYPGGRVEEKYYTCRLGGKKTRIKNCSKTPEAVAKVNARRAVRRLKELILEAAAPPPPVRKATKPTKGSVERRLKAKSGRSDIKKMRGKPSGE